jgi:protein tyrosine/serine phosphatase
VQKQRIIVVAILAITCIAVAITFILAGSNSSRRVAASVNATPRPLNDRSAQVTTTLPMFRRLDANYTRGAEPASGGIETLTRLGVKTVVDLRSIYDHTDDVGLAAEQAGLRYYWLPLGVWNPATDAQAREFVALVTDESKGPFYVFCDDGLHRTGEMSAIYRVARYRWSVEQALKEMDEVGFNPYYYSLRNYVWTYARKFNPQAVPLHARRVSAFE